MPNARLLLLIVAVAFLVTVVQLGILQVTFHKLGLAAESASLLLMVMPSPVPPPEPPAKDGPAGGGASLPSAIARSRCCWAHARTATARTAR